MKKAALIAAFFVLLAQVWYWGFSEGWRQASAALENSASPAETEAFRQPFVFPRHSGDSYQTRL